MRTIPTITIKDIQFLIQLQYGHSHMCDISCRNKKFHVFFQMNLTILRKYIHATPWMPIKCAVDTFHVLFFTINNISIFLFFGV